MSPVLQQAGSRETHEDTPRQVSVFSGGGVRFVCFSATGAEPELIADQAFTANHHLLANLESVGFSKLAEASFAEDWDSDADSIYDRL